MSRVVEAIGLLYDVFGRYGLGPRVEGCSHCVSENEKSALAEKPLRDFSPQDLSRYAFEAMTTWGTVADFKHFLPRLFELLALDPDAEVELYPEILLSKFDEANWLTWPDTEQQAVRSYLVALWDDALSQHPFHVRIEELLWGVARTRLDIRPFLKSWIAAESATAAEHLADFVNWVYPGLAKKGRLNAWLVPHEQQDAVREWLLSDRTRAHLESAFFRCSDEELAAKLSDAAQRLLWLRRA